MQISDLTVEEFRAIIREEVEKLAAEKNKSRYLCTSKAVEALGYNSRMQLIRAVETGLLRVGKEVHDRRAPNATQASYYFDIPMCEKRLRCLPERRKL